MVMSHPLPPDATDAALLHAVSGGLPLDPQPYAAVGKGLGMTEAEVIDRLGRLLADGTIRRLGVVVRHQELGYRANAMVVWALPEDRVTELGQRIGTLPFVTLSYRRPQRPGWPYNLFTMIHGRDRAAVLAQVDRIKELCGLMAVDSAVLFSGRRFKQRGASYGSLGTRPRGGPAPEAAAPDLPEPVARAATAPPRGGAYA
jgi:DNA-binding Lrp family transcriptional regulator